jgi:pimeloyl-ACP methyl ester carboxylesterase
MPQMLRLAVLIAAFLAQLTPPAVAQTDSSGPRLLKIAGVEMRVWTAGLEGRASSRPVVVLEAGSGADLDTWQPIFKELSQIAPVVAYDRLGLGQSAADPQTPTLARNVETLHDVLRAVTEPPYVLVGHSLGGVIVRGFAHRYAAETKGLVYLDVPDFEATRNERASVLTGESRNEALKPPTLPEIPKDTPSKLRPVYEQLLLEMRDDFPSARGWSQPAGIPVGVIVTARSDRVRGDGGALLRLQIKHQTEWTLGSPNSLFTIAGHTGHQVHRDDPALVLSVIRHIVKHASASVK